MMTPIKTSTATDVVYKRPEFSDLLTSNNFYTVTAIALVLGIASALGFIQNPRKLKAVVDTLSYKVSIAHPDNQKMSYQVFQQERYDLSASYKNAGAGRGNLSETSRFDDTRKYLYGAFSLTQPVRQNIRRVAFSYDITSGQFWSDLDSSSIGREKGNRHKDNYNSHPLSVLEEGDVFLEKGDSKYSVATDLRKN